jgi:hydrogenase-4 component B
VMVKFYGIVFLGQPRDPALSRAHDAGILERIGLAWLALGCVVLGLFPTYIVNVLGTVVTSLTGAALDTPSSRWWLVEPLHGRQASYSAVIFLVAIATVVALTIAAVSLFYHRRVNRVPPWDCGFGLLNASMQDTAEGFGQPIRHIFGSFFAIKRELPTPFDATPRYRVMIEDKFWRALYVPLGSIVERMANAIAWLQQGRIATYLLYSFITLVTLLALVL